MSLDSLLTQAGLEQETRIPPVLQWNPPLSGDMNLQIRKDGSWWHEGTRFQREKLVRLFASILKREGDDYFLVTPVEKWRIQVEDRPLQIILAERQGGDIKLLTNGGDVVIVNKEHPMAVSELDNTPVPEVLVRHNLWARFSRNAYYQLTELADINEQEQVSVSSGGETFIIG